MTKKILTSLVVATALTTSAMAYDLSELAAMDTNASNVQFKGAATNLSLATVNLGADANITIPDAAVSNSLIFPAFFSSTGWESTIRVINTSATKAMVAKVVFYDGTDSHELKDFNIYLSANDAWTGSVKIVDGQATVISTDDSAPVEASAGNPYPMATATTALSSTLGSNSGYIEVIGMVEGVAKATAATVLDSKRTTSQAFATYHGEHAALRADYATFSNRMRGATASSIFKSGVIQNKDVILPYIVAANVNAEPNFNAITTNTLAGDIRITNTTTGTDMVMPAINVNYDTATGALVYLEGEKANLIDVAIDSNGTAALGTNAYNLKSVEDNLENLSPKVAYITYGDAAVNNNYALFTSPFKRTIAQISTPVATTDLLTTVTSTYFNDADLRNASTNYGSFSLTASIYDMSENVMSAGQFSPATTPTIVLKNELDTTGTDISDTTKLPYYLDQASSSGFSKGFVILKNTTSTSDIPAIVTQMMATTAGSTTVTNWIHPTTTK